MQGSVKRREAGSWRVLQSSRGTGWTAFKELHKKTKPKTSAYQMIKRHALSFRVEIYFQNKTDTVINNTEWPLRATIVGHPYLDSCSLAW